MCYFDPVCRSRTHRKYYHVFYACEESHAGLTCHSITLGQLPRVPAPNRCPECANNTRPPTYVDPLLLDSSAFARGSQEQLRRGTRVTLVEDIIKQYLNVDIELLDWGLRKVEEEDKLQAALREVDNHYERTLPERTWTATAIKDPFMGAGAVRIDCPAKNESNIFDRRGEKIRWMQKETLSSNLEYDNREGGELQNMQIVSNSLNPTTSLESEDNPSFWSEVLQSMLIRDFDKMSPPGNKGPITQDGYQEPVQQQAVPDEKQTTNETDFQHILDETVMRSIKEYCPMGSLSWDDILN